MIPDRIESLRRMAESRPDDPRARFGLALEYERLGQWEDAVRELRLYLSATSDEGNAWGRLARALRQLGRDDEDVTPRAGRDPDAARVVCTGTTPWALRDRFRMTRGRPLHDPPLSLTLHNRRPTIEGSALPAFARVARSRKPPPPPTSDHPAR